MDGTLGPAGRAGRIEPEAIVVGRGQARVEGGRGLGHLGEEGVDGQRRRRRLAEGRLDLAGELAGIGDQPAAGILEHVGIVGRSQQRVGRDRHDAGLDGPPEQIEERRTVLHDHEQAIARHQTEGQQGVAGAVHPLGQFAVGDGLVQRPDGRLGAAAFREVPVDERLGDVEAGGQPDLERAVE